MKKILTAACLIAVCAGGFAATADDQSNDYSKPVNWLCLPDRADVCSDSNAQNATIVQADGTLTPQPFVRAQKPAIDCFYVYPTVVPGPGPFSDMTETAGIRDTAAQQIARFSSVCRVFAPLYRQATLGAMMKYVSGQNTDSAPDMLRNYHDVEDAWKYYLAHYNKGRGVVLVGHSQGSAILKGLIQHDIDGQPVQKKIVVAILAGIPLQVPVGKDIGGDFKHIALCHSATDVGCVVNFSSFRTTLPPSAKTLFGISTGPGLEAACVNPAALAGGSGEAMPYFTSTSPSQPESWAPGKSITTTFVTLPGLLSAECTHNDFSNYLAITVHPGTGDARAHDIPGDLTLFGPEVTAQWGLHVVDMNLFMGNLISIVPQEADAYRLGKR